MRAVESPFRTRRFGVFEVDLRAAELRKHGVRIKLQEQPFQILSLLLEHPGEVVTRDELREKLWRAHTFVDFDRSLNKAMTKLRAALGDSADCPRYVETIPRHGYRFLAPVYQPQLELPHEHAAARDLHEELSQGNGKHAAQTWKKLRFYGLIAAVGVAAAAVYVATRVSRPGELSSSSSTVSPRPSVAVLSFTNLSGNPHEAWLATAFSDWLTTELTAGEQVRAIPAERIARMKMELSMPDVDSLGPESLIRIRKNLGTDYVVAGSYATLAGKPDGQIRLDLRLQDTQTGETIGAISETGTEVHLLDLVSRAGQYLRGKLGVRAATREEAAEVAIALPTKGETARLYSEGLAKLRAFDALRARDLLQKAIAVEPNYALSHAALATAWGQLGYDENAKAEAKKAFDLSSNLSRAGRLLVEARYRETSRDWEKAGGIYRALFEFFPDNLEYGLALANAEYTATEWKDALDTIAVLRKLPAPLCDDPRIDLVEEDAARSLGDTKRSEAAVARAAEKAQAAGASLLLARARADQAWLFENLGRFSEVEGPVREAKQLYASANDRAGAARATVVGAIALGNKGDYLGAKKSYEEALALYREIGKRTGQAGENNNIGDILLYLGDLEGARRGYEASFSIYQEVGDQNGEALAENGLGDVYLALGNHQKAKEMYQSSIGICRRIGNPAREAGALSGLGRIHRLEADPEQALRDLTEARKKFEEIGDKTQVGRVDLYLSELFLDKGEREQAAMSARRAAEVYEANKTPVGEAAANLLLARTLLMSGRISEAREKVDQAAKVASETHNRELALSATVARARVRASAGDPKDVREALGILKNLVGAAGGSTFAEQLYEARLAFGEIELRSADKSLGRSYLEALQKEAAGQGFQLIAQKAAAVLGESRNQAALDVQN